MSDSPAKNAIVRKIRPRSGGAAQATGGDVWGRALARAADERLGLELRLAEFREQATRLSAMLPVLPSDAVLIGLDLTSGAGLAVADRELLTGLVEMQTTGRVSASPAEVRAVTALDFALVADALAPWLATLSDAEALPDGPPMPSRHFADARAVELGMDDGSYRCARATLDLGGGARLGTLTILWPERQPARAPVPSGDIAAAVLPLPSRLEAILCRVRIPLSRIASAEVGTVVPLPGATVRSITLEAPRGRVICPGHLGQSGGRRAVRIGAPAPAPATGELRGTRHETGAREGASPPDPSEGFPGLGAQQDLPPLGFPIDGLPPLAS